MLALLSSPALKTSGWSFGDEQTVQLPAVAHACFFFAALTFDILDHAFGGLKNSISSFHTFQTFLTCTRTCNMLGRHINK